MTQPTMSHKLKNVTHCDCSSIYAVAQQSIAVLTQLHSLVYPEFTVGPTNHVRFAGNFSDPSDRVVTKKNKRHTGSNFRKTNEYCCVFKWMNNKIQMNNTIKDVFFNVKTQKILFLFIY